MKLVLLRLNKTEDAYSGMFILYSGLSKTFECAVSEPLFEHAANASGIYDLKLDWDNSLGKCLIANNGDNKIVITTPTKRPKQSINVIHVVRRNTCLADRDTLLEMACTFTLESLIGALDFKANPKLHIVDISE